MYNENNNWCLGALEFVLLSQQAFHICLVFVVCILCQDGNSNKSFLLRIWYLLQEVTVCASSPERKGKKERQELEKPVERIHIKVRSRSAGSPEMNPRLQARVV
ncbi:Histone-Lysine N-Methyltransferase Prdm9 [Manis pentadactyla]|nr:Histone-Lysine N-Methyltransferase Prdm9 [Manis pentadactyla]